MTLTKRAALMDSQVDVLEGKRRALARYRDAVALYLESVRGLGGGAVAAAWPSGGGAAVAATHSGVNRMVVDAQEDLRREIARAMHDGPAQSLTNIVLQAQIVERLVERDPASAAGEVRLLTSMVQQTLDATKSFIFDVRPMVLDDLGLVPTLRRAARERGRRAGVPVEFETLGQDRRLPVDLESGLFRMLDDALAAYLAAGPDAVRVHLDWGEQLEARVSATRAVVEAELGGRRGPDPGRRGRQGPAAGPGRDAWRSAARATATRPSGGHAGGRRRARSGRVGRGRGSARPSIGVTAELLADGGDRCGSCAPLPAVAAEPARRGA